MQDNSHRGGLKQHSPSASCTDPDSCQRLRSCLEEAVPRDRRQNPGGQRLAEGLLRVRGKREGAHDRFHAALQQKQQQRSATPTHVHLFCGLFLSEAEPQMVPQTCNDLRNNDCFWPLGTRNNHWL